MASRIGSGRMQQAFVALVSVAVLGIGPASGEDPPRPAARTFRHNREAGFSLSGEASSGNGDELRYRLVRSLGYFVTETWQVGGAIGVLGPFDDLPSSLAEVRIDRHFPQAAGFLPYVGLGCGLRTGIVFGDTTTAALTRAHGGFKAFVTDKVALTFELGASFGGDGFRERGLLLSVGVSQFFLPPTQPGPDRAGE